VSDAVRVLAPMTVRAAWIQSTAAISVQIRQGGK